MIDVNISDDTGEDGPGGKADRQVLTLSHGGQTSRFHGIWLLDNAPTARDAQNGQRLLSFDALPDQNDPAKSKIHTAEIQTEMDTELGDPASSTSPNITITIGDPVQTITFAADWLIAHRYDCDRSAEPGWVEPSSTLWNRDSSVPSGDFSTIANDPAALCKWLGHIREFGFAKLTDGPTKSGALLDIVDLFGYVRETNYGRLFDVRSEVNPTNLAYTGLALQAHTDNPYRDPVPTMQILYCLENSASGGESQVVDGFNAAAQLRDIDPDAFASLTRYQVRFTYEGAAGIHLTSRKPIIALSNDGELLAVHFNNRSIAPLTDVPFDEMASFYRAIKAFGALIDAPENQLSFKLAPGDSFLVDNTRVLHGRNGYDGEGTRWLQGCYPDRDGLNSTLDGLLMAGE